MGLKLALYVTLMVAVSISSATLNPVIKSPAGSFKGTRETAVNGEFYHSFRGIPYAQPPVGKLRFRQPVPASPVDGVYDATYFRPYCIQIILIPSDFNFGQEDCLYLNVFTPESAAGDDDDGDLKKVFVFFHGGGNFNGFPDAFIPGTLVTDHDIVVVTVAYRLGFLGLLSTMSPGCEGNFHLRDQLLSLTWVQQNIRHFGGDPSAVTIGGESAGGFDSSLLALASGSRDLFSRVYCQSGTTGVKYSHVITNPRPTAVKLGRQLACIGSHQPDPASEQDFDNMVDCLRKLPALSFAMNGSTGEIPHLQAVLYGDMFPKNVEELFSDEAYLNSIKFLDRDYLVGVNENEGGMFDILNAEIEKTIPEEVKKNLPPNFLSYNTFKMFLNLLFGPVSETVLQKVVGYYEENNEFGALADFASDACFHLNTLQYVAAASAGRSSEDSRVYLFQFFHDADWVTPPPRGFSHGQDLFYLFEMDTSNIMKIYPLKTDLEKWNERDDQMKKKFTTLVADFIKTGDPSRSLKHELPSGWPGFDKKREQYLKLGLNLEVKHHLFVERVALWTEQIPEWIRQYPVSEGARTEL